MHQRLNHLEAALTADIQKLNNHSIYGALNEMADVRLFMEHHVYAVWDFMSLLKFLQQELTCTQVPWMPGKNAHLSRFINEIVMGEESDVDPSGKPASHFDLYLDAMKEVGAQTTPMFNFLNSVKEHGDITRACMENQVPASVRHFLEFTFQTIATGDAHRVAAAFTFGREDVIPDMFEKLLAQSKEENKAQFPQLVYYLERHIELDGDEHGPLSLQMIAELCGDDEQKWIEAEDTAKMAIRHRIHLWDGVNNAIGTVQNVISELV